MFITHIDNKEAVIVQDHTGVVCPSWELWKTTFKTPLFSLGHELGFPHS